MKLSDFEAMKPGTKILVNGSLPSRRTFDFGYISREKFVILYEEGECNMQDAIAVKPDQCSPTPELAEELAERDGNEFAEARALMAKELREDEGLRIGYQANVAMLLHDNFCGADFKVIETREKAAKQILKKIFEG